MNKRDRADRARIQQKIATDTEFAVHALRLVWSLQKPEEQFAGAHIGSDGVGFRPHEAESLNDFYEELEAQDWRLTAYQADKVRRVMRPYWRQVRDQARAKKASAAASRPESPRERRRVVKTATGGEARLDRERRPESSPLDSLRGVFDNMSNHDKQAAIDRLAERFNV